MSDIYEILRGNLDTLSRPTAFIQAWPKLIRSYALDAIYMRMTGESSSILPLEKGGQGGI